MEESCTKPCNSGSKKFSIGKSRMDFPITNRCSSLWNPKNTRVCVCFHLRQRQKPPLCKGRWLAEGETEGLLPLSSSYSTGGFNPSVASRQRPLHKGANIITYTKPLCMNRTHAEGLLYFTLSWAQTAGSPVRGTARSSFPAGFPHSGKNLPDR